MQQKIQESLAMPLNYIASEYYEFKTKSKYDDASDAISGTHAQRLLTRAIAAIERATGKNSVYYEQAIGEFNKKGNAHLRLASIIGIVDAARVDIEAGYLQSFEQLIHSEIFADYLEMAGHLIETGYKDAAAVIAGSTLEAHLKQLCEKYEVDIENGGKPKKADALNAELVKASAYSKLDQKNVTAWLGLRNNAAHGSYGEYDIQQVRLFLAGIQAFITRNPA